MNPDTSRNEHTRTRRLGAWALAAFFGAAGSAACAHEGHDHADAAPAAQAPDRQPRLEARTPDYELVGIVEKAGAGANLRIYLDRHSDNSPVGASEIVVEVAPDRSIAAKADGDSFVAELGPLAAGTRMPLVFAISEGERHDLMGGILEIPAAGTAAAPATAPENPIMLWGAAAALAVILALVIARMRGTRRAA
ncbi:MAG: hypothetical protein JNJ60_12540 [Rhodocyclaceae bacterium]|nr:hypothetical protein [Rhodocyclaceae bacterium]